MAKLKRRLTAGLTMSLLAALGVLAGEAGAYAPPDRPGPPLSVPAGTLAAALHCNARLAGALHTPVLLVPGTTLNPQSDFGYGWEPSLAKLGIPSCTIDLPGNAMADIQVAGEYLVSAIRTMHAAYGNRIDIIGHSQGGMVPRWALRFWPDTRAMVDDLIGLSPSNHGTYDADFICKLTCAPAIWQQQRAARFLDALNSSQETFPGISYTNIYTLTDEVVVPNFGPAASSSLNGDGGATTNVPIQHVCPTDLTEHLGVGIYDNTAYALALDALTHAGPVVPSRVSPTVCLNPFMPGIDAATFPANYAATLGTVSTTLAAYPRTSAEPPLACYTATAGCRQSRPARRHQRSARRHHHHRSARHHHHRSARRHHHHHQA